MNTESWLVAIVALSLIAYGIFCCLTGLPAEGVGLIIIGLCFIVVRIIHFIFEMKI